MLPTHTHKKSKTNNQKRDQEEKTMQNEKDFNKI